ncbi:molybdate ABC transporter substrate-binding protein [Leeuwenhoekiella palythoae]|uniref:Molybdate transport system substrate-binding protein n=1 Tax=Leeuwenhoekiella palythoae TaxID=573501 RepID=A0A1M5Z6T8_9FLAO|nr:molybdate ABC transporter substrate-binding protein [Leeuwenhoekiella palythoae]RXG28243.1 molybdate transport system substrate-binding protein [Leeuwenhoekiella palythoae]SHI19966.1 molybdate transport system substrate-binding protein [Leeuwenhoekiella palythoae]
MRKLQRIYISLLLFTTAFTACKEVNDNPKLTIATAANMQFAMQRLADDFTKDTGVPCELVISSSGKLTAQLKAGAPYDIFVAANMKYPQEVYDAGIAATSPRIYAYGKLVIWTLRSELKPEFATLQSNAVKHIALANPKTAPYGEAAVAALSTLQLEEAVADKLVYGESIAQTNQFIISGAAEIGFTALSVVKAPSLKTKGFWAPVADSLYKPIAQGVVRISQDAAKKQQAEAFYAYLFTEEAQKILQDFGYSVGE